MDYHNVYLQEGKNTREGSAITLDCCLRSPENETCPDECENAPNDHIVTRMFEASSKIAGNHVSLHRTTDAQDAVQEVASDRTFPTVEQANKAREDTPPH